MRLLDHCRNEDGTYNGVRLMATMSGISEEEVFWTVERLKELVKGGMPAKEASKLALEEARGRPWLKS